MKLFDDAPRSDPSPMKKGETQFGFYNRSSRPEYETYRRLLQGWLDEMPPADAAELAHEMRSGADARFSTGTCELIIHASLRRLGYSVDVHPRLAGSAKHPDFLANDAEGKPLAYIEVVTINPPKEEVSEAKREAAIYDALDVANIPSDLRLGYTVLETSADNAAVSRLKSAVEKWATEHADEARKSQGYSRVFTSGGWEIEVSLFVSSTAHDGGRRIVVSGLPAISMATTTPSNMLSDAVQKKATRYGRFDVPYVVAVFDRTSLLAVHSSDFAESVVGGLFGPEILEEVMYTDGRTELRERRGNGLWFRSGARDDRFNRVSAVLAFPRDDVWCLREERWQPLLVRNPNADVPLPDGVLPYGEAVMTEEECKLTPGRNAGDTLGLPEPWPPEEA